eukprot:15211692-Alexandrium_andersonii.AAC.1
MCRHDHACIGSILGPRMPRLPPPDTTCPELQAIASEAGPGNSKIAGPPSARIGESCSAPSDKEGQN